ncbi:MAG: lipopolysaccharide biosynthesis protein [Eubacteriales bacterium]|nr:lipopolysaccharide biosynthesis protein [Eubacteriales bacterium]
MKSEGKVLSNLIWRFAERCGAQSVTLVVSIVLARLLDPKVYGTVALITVFTSILQKFVDCGLGTALIQKKDADDLDFSSVFFFNIFSCLLIYALLFFSAPAIAKFYDDEALTALIRVMSLMIVISGVKNVQQAYVSRTLQFKRFFYATLGGTIGAAVVGIWMAYKGMGVWALVVQQLFNAAVDTTILWFTVKWRPKRMFSFERLKTLFDFGWKLLVSGVIDTVCIKLSDLIIGKLYSSSALAYFNKGAQFPEIIAINVNSSIDSVLLPVMSSQQESVTAVREMTRKAIRISSYIMWPVMLGLAACAEPLVRLILTDKWLPCVPFLRIACISYATYPIHTANLNAIKAIGRSDLFLTLEIIKSVLRIVLLAVTMNFGVIYMAFGMLASTMLAMVVNAYPNKKLLDYSFVKQLRDIVPSALLSFVMAAAVRLVELIGMPDVMTLILQIIAGAVFYAVSSKLLRMEEFDYAFSTVRSMLKKEN